MGRDSGACEAPLGETDQMVIMVSGREEPLTVGDSPAVREEGPRADPPSVTSKSLSSCCLRLPCLLPA